MLQNSGKYLILHLEDIYCVIHLGMSGTIHLINRKNFNRKLFDRFKRIQFSSSYKKRKSHFIIKNDFKKQSVKNGIKNILITIL